MNFSHKIKRKQKKFELTCLENWIGNDDLIYKPFSSYITNDEAFSYICSHKNLIQKDSKFIIIVSLFDLQQYKLFYSLDEANEYMKNNNLIEYKNFNLFCFNNIYYVQ